MTGGYVEGGSMLPAQIWCKRANIGDIGRRNNVGRNGREGDAGALMTDEAQILGFKTEQRQKLIRN